VTKELAGTEPNLEDEVERDEVDEKTGALWRTSNKRKAMFAPLDVPPLLVYRALKGKYGPPNPGYDETKSQWSYKITGLHSIIDVWDYKMLSWIMIISPDPSVKREDRRQVLEQDWAEFLSWLREACQKLKIPRDNYKHLFILNGFKQLYTNGDYFMKCCKELDSENLEENPMIWAAGVSYLLSAEALLNLTFETYLADEVRNNKDMVNRIMMFSMQDKWAFAASVCDCFATQLDKSSKGYEALQRLVVLRNNLAHSNISRDIKTYVIEEDEMEFVISPDFQLYHEVMDPHSITLADVEQIRHDVDLVTEGIVKAMKPRPRKQFPRLLQDDRVGIHKGKPSELVDRWVD
jgi:hypothetical protein